MNTDDAIFILTRLKKQVETAAADLAAADPDQQLSDTDAGLETLLDGISDDLSRLQAGVFE